MRAETALVPRTVRWLAHVLSLPKPTEIATENRGERTRRIEAYALYVNGLAVACIREELTFPHTVPTFARPAFSTSTWT